MCNTYLMKLAFQKVVTYNNGEKFNDLSFRDANLSYFTVMSFIEIPRFT